LNDYLRAVAATGVGAGEQDEPSKIITAFCKIVLSTAFVFDAYFRVDVLLLFARDRLIITIGWSST